MRTNWTIRVAIAIIWLAPLSAREALAQNLTVTGQANVDTSITPNRLNTNWPAGHMTLHSPGHLFLTSQANVHLGANVYFDGSAWNRYNTASGGGFWWAGNDGSLAAYQTGAGANPIGAFTNPLWITTTGNVGIGTTSPQSSLDVNGYVTVRSVNGEGGYLKLLGNNGVNVFLESLNGEFRLLNSPWTAELFHVDQSGNTFVAGSLGIGTASPGYVLDVTDRIRLRQGPNGSAGLWLYQNTPAANRAFIGMVDDNSVGIWTAGGGFSLYAAQDGSGYAAKNMYWNGGSSRLGADNGIELGGLTGSGVANTPYIDFHFNNTSADYSMRIINDQAGRLLVTGGNLAATVVSPSSRAFKTNIRHVSAAEYRKMLDRLLSTDLAHYHYKREVAGADAARPRIGFIAEELPSEILSSDGKNVDLYELVGYSIGAMKAQNAQIAEQRREISELRDELKRLAGSAKADVQQ